MYFQAFAGQASALQCPVPLASLLACHRCLRVRWIMFTLYLQRHRSAFTGQCVVTASPHQCLTCSPISGLCVFTAEPSPQPSAGPLAYPPQTTALSRVLHFCPRCSFLFISYTCSNPATPQYGCVSFFGLHDVSPSLFPAVHQLPSVSHRPTWSHNVRDIHSSEKIWGQLRTWALHTSRLLLTQRLLCRVLFLPYSLLF